MLIDNTLFLRERFPEIRKYFLEKEKELDMQRIDIVASKSGLPTARVTLTEQGKELMIHSMYDPVREAERIIKSHAIHLNDDTHVFFYGIGMGYHIEKFKELYPDHTYSIYEPLPEMFFKLASEVELTRFITNKTLNLYVEKQDGQTLEYLNEFQIENRKIHLIILPSYENIAKEKKEEFLKNIKETILNRRTNLHTKANFQKLWVTNSLNNFKEVLDTPNIIKDIDKVHFEGKPAVIVSAGPSLAEDIEHIRYIKDNQLAYVFSVGSAINSLLSHNILPDAVLTYDPGMKNHLVFEKMIEQKIVDVPMIFGSSVGSETIANYDGPKAHFITSQDRTSLYFLDKQLDIKHDLILDSPSIAVMTFQLLNKLEADPIIFAGQNLGYLYNRLYSEGIEYKHIQATVDQDKLAEAPTTIDVFGNSIKTNQTFNSMRKSIESFASFYDDRTFINTTKGGAAIEGVPFKPIEEVIEQNLIQPITKEVWWETNNSYNHDRFAKQFQSLQSSKEALHVLLNQLERVLHAISNATKFKNKNGVETGLGQFDYLYNKMIENPYYESFLSFYMRVQVEFISNEIKRLNREQDVFVKGRNISKLCSKFAEQSKRALEELGEILDSSIRRTIEK